MVECKERNGKNIWIPTGRERQEIEKKLGEGRTVEEDILGEDGEVIGHTTKWSFIEIVEHAPCTEWDSGKTEKNKDGKDIPVYWAHTDPDKLWYRRGSDGIPQILSADKSEAIPY